MMASIQSATSVRNVSDNIEKLTIYDDMVKAFEELTSEEEHVNQDVNLLLQREVALDAKMQTLHLMLPNLHLVQNDAKQLAGMISFTSTLAENVSGKVRQLDLAKSRVAMCMQRVEDVLDLKFCTDGVQTALQDEDYEKAAAHVHRFLSLDENVLRMSADASEGSTLDMSFKLLHEAQAKLKNIVHNRFDAAVRSGDIASVERFFKTFPLIGEHKEGLEKFSKYLCSQLNDTANKNLKLSLASSPEDKRSNVLYADTLTLLFESIARAVEIHQPLVETYYGHGKMLIMVQFLQKECDRQARLVIDNFRKNRDYDRKLVTQESHSKVISECNLSKEVSSVQQSNVYQKPASERIDPKDIDVLLAEITLMNTRTELYIRFLRRRVMADFEVQTQDEDKLKEFSASVDQFLTRCDLSCLMQDFIGSYIMMEEYFMRMMVIKAVNMDSIEDGSLTSSMVDDVFFVVKKCIRRALSSSSVDGVCAMLNHACTILEQDFREVLFTKLRQGFPVGFDLTQAYNLMQSTFAQGRLQNADVETEKLRATFLITLNNSEVGCEYVETLKTNIEVEIEKLYSQVSDQGKAKLQSCLSDLGAISGRFKHVLDFGFSQLVSNVIKLRIKPLMDSFLATSHNITETDFTNFEANDPWVQNFIFNLDGLLASFKSSLTPSNYDTLVGHVSSEITVQLEKALMKMTFNRLGGLQYDKELRTLVGYLTSVTTWTIRDKFARLTQMATILNLERVDEILDYWGSNSGPLTWRLTPAEVRQVLMLRVDFRGEDIKRLKL